MQIKNGLRQGVILSPLLFYLYINEVTDEIFYYNVGTKLRFYIPSINMHTDDLVVLSSLMKGLKVLLNNSKGITTWFCLKINYNKSYNYEFL